MLDIDVDVKDGVSPVLAEFIDSLEGQQFAELNEVGARGAVNAAIEYHDEFNEAGKWRGDNYLGSGAGKSGDFGQNVALGWQFQTSSTSGATITNNADYYAFKVTGGTVVPKRAEALTIPMVEEAVWSTSC